MWHKQFLVGSLFLFGSSTSVAHLFRSPPAQISCEFLLTCVESAGLAQGVLSWDQADLNPGAPVGTIRQQFGRRELAVAGLLFVGVGFSRTAEAQVGLRSAPVQVALVARAIPGGSIHGAGDLRGTRRSGTALEGTHTLRLSANSNYLLVVRGPSRAAHAPRTWVRSVNGDFQEITSGSAVTVARNPGGVVEVKQLVQYLIQSSPGGDSAPLPVTYELHIAPTL